MKKIFIALLSLSCFGFTGCTDWLETQPKDRVSDDYVWNDMGSISLATNYFYAAMRNYSPFFLYDSAYGLTDGFTETLKYNTMYQMPDNGQINRFLFGINDYSVDVMNAALGGWGTAYGYISRVNEFLYGLDTYSHFSDEELVAYRAQARFFRGYFYWQLLKRSCPVVLRDENMPDYLNKRIPMSTEDECWDFVYDDLLFAAQNLPEQWPSAERERVTKYAAWAFMSRAMLTAERYDVVKVAADSVINSGKYTLMPGTTAASYRLAFTSMSEGNTESILEYNFSSTGPTHTYDYRFAPAGDASEGIIPHGYASPTQEMVEYYELAGGGSAASLWQPYHTTTGVAATPPYSQLEPRFHASVLYNGATWKGRTIESFVGGADGFVDAANSLTSPAGRSSTSYYVKKYLDETRDSWSTTNSTQPWIVIRLAEVYLNRAEANYRLGDEGAARSDMNEVRKRVGLNENNSVSGTALFDAIRQERRVELAFEGHLLWDMIRWNLHTQYNGMRVHGLRIERSGSTDTYHYMDVDGQDRRFEERFGRVPVPTNEIKYNNLVQQYPEWR